MLGTKKDLIINKLFMPMVASNRTYASIGAKSKIPDKYNDFDKETKKNLLGNHVQLITDFNLIYEDPKQIKLYQIGSLITKPSVGSHNVSQIQNYRFEKKTQYIVYVKKPIPVEKELHIVKKSKKYFDQQEVKENIENTNEYKNLFNEVLNELKSKNITVRLPNTKEDENLTGYNVLLNKLSLKEKNEYMETLPITNE